MIHKPFDEMQKAVDVVRNSPHPVNKIASNLVGIGPGGLPFSICMTNYWPDPIHRNFPPEQRFGDASGTIHSEIATLLTAPCTEGSAIYVTDPPCPNCAKSMMEAGVAAIYIDSKGFEKDFANRRLDQFNDMSMKIFAKAGAPVFIVHRKTQSIEPLLAPETDSVPHVERPVAIAPAEAATAAVLFQQVEDWAADAGERKFAVALATNPSGELFSLSAFGHVAVGYSWEADHDEIVTGSDKYTYMLEPLNRLLMNAARRGVKLVDGLIYATRIPTAREQVNMVGAGISEIFVRSRDDARDQFSLDAMALFEQAEILKFKPSLRGAQ